MGRGWRARTVVGVMALLVLPVTADGGGPSQKDVLARAGRRVVQYQAELPHLIATETSVQLATAPPAASSRCRNVTWCRSWDG